MVNVSERAIAQHKHAMDYTKRKIERERERERGIAPGIDRKPSTMRAHQHSASQPTNGRDQDYD